MKVTLTVTKGPSEGRVIEFGEPRGFVIGRAKDADLQLSSDDPYVSRRHVYLEVCPPHCRLRNLGTTGDGATNPPHVNGETMFEDCDLKAGDVIELGYTQLRVAIAAPAPAGSRTCTCRACGQSFEVPAGPLVPDECPPCEDKEKRRRAPAPAHLAVSCEKCGRDLSERANSDGQAAALRGVAIYLCESCVPRVEEFAAVSIGPYHVVQHLGEGGFGTVYLVYHPPTARILALKRMKELKEKVLVRRFEREVRINQDLIHPNIVRCLDVGTDREGAPFLVTEYVAGGDLETMFQSGLLPSAAKLSLVKRVLDGLEHLHARQIVHRDIKPQNILMRVALEQGRGPSSDPIPRPVICDFGLAVSYARAGGTRLTKPGTGFGTLMYMPPEQVRDAFSVRESADVYAVGVTLYYLLTGRYTFDFPTPADVLELQRQKPDLWRKPQEALRVLMQLHRVAHPFNIILSEEPIPILKRDPSIGSRLATVIDKAVRKPAGERYQSAAEFRAALDRAVN